MVFPIGARVWELAADHLDRLPRKSLIDRLVHHSGVTNDGYTASTKQPQDSAESRGNEAKDGDSDEQTGVELRRSSTKGTDDEVLTAEATQNPQTGDKQDNIEQQKRACDEGVDAQNEEDDHVVAGELSEVVVDAGLHLAEVGGFGEALEVEEFADGPQVGEPAGERRVAEAFEAVAYVQTGRQNVERDLYARHGD